MSYSWYILLFFNSEFHCGTKLTVHAIYISKLLLWSNRNSVTIYLVSNDSLKSSIKSRIKIIKMRQFNCAEHLFCSVYRINFTNVVIFHNGNFLLFTFGCCNFSSTYNIIFRSSQQRCFVKKVFLKISLNS